MDDPRAKGYCVLCLSTTHKSGYLEYGNYCYRCTVRINHLSRLYPGDTYSTMTEERMGEHYNKKRYYEQESKKF